MEWMKEKFLVACAIHILITNEIRSHMKVFLLCVCAVEAEKRKKREEVNGHCGNFSRAFINNVGEE
jgi:hypothetical protein